MDDERAATIARALAHPARIRILRLLASQDVCRGADVFAGLPLAQSTISQHLSVLKKAGLVHATPQGPAMLYCINAEPLGILADVLDAIVTDHPTCEGKG